MESNTQTEHIDVTPTWEQILPVLITLIDNGAPNGYQRPFESKGRAGAISELQRMAQIADAYVKQSKEK